VAFLRISINMARDLENLKRLQQEWYQRNKELVKERARQWKRDNPEKRAEHRKRWKKKNVEANKKHRDAYKARNPHKFNAYNGKRRAAKLLRTPSWLTPDDLFIIEEAYHLAKLRTETLGILHHVDHILPLQGKTVSGLHVPTNLQVIPAKLNLQKSNKHE
jgi:hypothetical protein